MYNVKITISINTTEKDETTTIKSVGHATPKEQTVKNRKFSYKYVQ